jgi:ribosomal protein S18 acetylase RimI-like enzyme
MADILILTGPPGAGKTSVALALADRYDRVAHINVDALRHFVTPTGYRAPGKPGFERQQALATRNACDLARNFIAERFAVIIDDIVPALADLDRYVEGLKYAGVSLHFVRLLPSRNACSQRNRARKADRVPEDRLRSVYAQFESAGDLPGSVIDNSALTVEATADRLQALTTSGESIVWRPGLAQMLPDGVEVRPRERADDAWIARVLTDWGARRVVSRGRVHDPMTLPGFVALVDGREAGLATYRIDGDACELVTLNSLEEGRGAGSLLIQAVSNAAKTQGCHRLWLITTNDNAHALRFYQRGGFRIVAIHVGAIDESRRLKPEISAVGLDGIPIRDEIELEIALV